MKTLIFWDGDREYFRRMVPNDKEYHRYYKFTPSQATVFENNASEVSLDYVKIRTDNLLRKLPADNIFWSTDPDAELSNFETVEYDDIQYKDLDAMRNTYKRIALTDGEMCVSFTKDRQGRHVLRTNERRLVIPNEVCEIFGFRTNDDEKYCLFEASAKHVADRKATVPPMQFYIHYNAIHPTTGVGDYCTSCFQLLSREEGETYTEYRPNNPKFFQLTSPRIAEHIFVLRHLDHSDVQAFDAGNFFLLECSYRKSFSLDF